MPGMTSSLRWCLVAKTFAGTAVPEIRLGRWTDAELRNNQRHGWRLIDRWPLRPTETRIREVIFNWRQATARSNLHNTES